MTTGNDSGTASRLRRLMSALLIAALAALHLPGLAHFAIGDGNLLAASNAKQSTAARVVEAVATRLAPRSGEGQVGVYGGMTRTRRSDVTLLRPAGGQIRIPAVGWQGLDFTEPVYYGVRITRWFAGALGGMVDFTHAKAIAPRDQQVTPEASGGATPIGPATIGQLFRKLEFSHGHNMLTLNGLWRLPFGSSGVRPYVGLGAGVALPHTEIWIEGDASRTYEYQLTGPVVQGLAGVEIRLERGLSFFIEYKLAFSSTTAPLSGQDGSWLGGDLFRQFRRWASGERPRDGQARTDLLTHQWLGGISIRLEPPVAAPRADRFS